MQFPSPIRMAACLALMLSGLSGCADHAQVTPPPIAQEDPASADLPPPSPGDLVLGAATSTTYQGLQSRRMLVERDPPTGGSDTTAWTVRRFLSKGDTPIDHTRPATREQRFAIDASGALILLEEINRAEEVEVVFSPGLVVLPAGLSLGATQEQTLEMVVHPLGNRAKVRQRGPMNSSVTFEGRERVLVGNQEIDAFRFRSSFTATLKPASVLNESTQWFAPGRALVREIERERTTVFGVTIRDNSDRWDALP